MDKLLDRPYPFLRRITAAYVGLCFSAGGYYFCNYPLVVMLVPSAILFAAGYYASQVLLTRFFGQHRVGVASVNNKNGHLSAQLRVITHRNGFLNYPYKTTLAEIEAELNKTFHQGTADTHLLALKLVRDNPQSFYANDRECAERKLSTSLVNRFGR